MYARALSTHSSFDSFGSSAGTSHGRSNSLASSRHPLLARHRSRSLSEAVASSPPLAMRRLSASASPELAFAGLTATAANLAPSRPINPFATESLRRRFSARAVQPHAENQLLGELLWVLAAYVRLYGRRVKVSGSVVAGSSGSRASSPKLQAEPTFASLAVDDEATHSDEMASQSRSKLQTASAWGEEDAAQLANLCIEIDALVKEVVDVAPSFGTALTQGSYGPLASRRPDRSSIEAWYAEWAPETRDGRWWAERLLRDLIEGLLMDNNGALRLSVVADQSRPEQEVLTGALAALIEEDEEEWTGPSVGAAGVEATVMGERERKLLEEGRQRWLKFQSRTNAVVA